ncbi:amino acid ABC transporter substrate-binding protein [candidate division KSB1 bacterium]|nr:amino acid ABC transporter substrate-binding protein [candidate division KSB1 bacterium]
MKKATIILCILSLIWITSCIRNLTETETPTHTISLGFTTTQTGNNSLVSTRQTNGLTLWINQINAAGGITLEDGSIIKFTAVSHDDAGDEQNVKDLYTQMIMDEDVDILFSPYTSSLTDAAAAIADEHGKLLITIGAASDASYEKGYTSVFQTYTPASRYLAGAIDLLAHLDQDSKKIAYIHENSGYSTIVAEAARAYAEGLGYETVLMDNYEIGEVDFESYIDDIIANEADVVLGGGHFQDGADFTQQLDTSDVDLDFLALLVAPPEPEFTDIGDAALGVIGPSQWEASVKFSPESAADTGLEWFGPLNDDFIEAYETAYNEEPSYHSMGGYAAGLILQKAILDANATSTAAVVTALNEMDILTCYGHIKFDTSTAAHGLQIGHDMVYIQWQEDDADNLIKQVVWPQAGATAEAIYPKP